MDHTGRITFNDYRDYSADFAGAVDFTEGQDLSLDSPIDGPINADLVHKAVTELADGLDEQIGSYARSDLHGNSPYRGFGADCGNVHNLIAKFLIKHYPSLNPNFVMGGVDVNGRDEPKLFDLPQDRFLSWRKQKSGIGEHFNCHAWVSLGNDGWIIDATISTWILTREHDCEEFGPILYGPLPSLNHKRINASVDRHKINHFHFPSLDLQYHPAVIGLQALDAANTGLSTHTLSAEGRRLD